MELLHVLVFKRSTGFAKRPFRRGYEKGSTGRTGPVRSCLDLLVHPLQVPAELHAVDDHVEEGEVVVLEALLPVAADALADRQHELRADLVQVHRQRAVVWGCNVLYGLRQFFVDFDLKVPILHEQLHIGQYWKGMWRHIGGVVF